MKLSAKFTFGLSLLALSLSALAGPTYAPKPDPLQGDGRVSAFYTWQDAIPPTGQAAAQRTPGSHPEPAQRCQRATDSL